MHDEAERRRNRPWRSALWVLTMAISGVSARSQSDVASAGPATAASQAPVAALGASAPAIVVELFTSEGCSSCPPADALLARLAREPGLAGRVVPLAFHVDYWNSLGWRDPFSTAAWSERQGEYAQAFGGGRIYTPQAVIAGHAECVGSDEEELRAQIAAAGHRPTGQLSVRREGESLAITAAPPRGGKPVAVMVAIYERDHTTAVPSGENGGRSLTETFVVRRLDTAFLTSPTVAAERIVPLHVDPAWRGLRLGVAVFLQDPSTREVYGGRSIDL